MVSSSIEPRAPWTLVCLRSGQPFIPESKQAGPERARGLAQWIEGPATSIDYFYRRRFVRDYGIDMRNVHDVVMVGGSVSTSKL